MSLLNKTLVDAVCRINWDRLGWFFLFNMFPYRLPPISLRDMLMPIPAPLTDEEIDTLFGSLSLVLESLLAAKIRGFAEGGTVALTDSHRRPAKPVSLQALSA